MEIFNEVIIELSSMCLIFYTDWIPNAELQYQLGYVMIVLVCICIICNLLLIINKGSNSIYLIGVKNYRLMKQKLCKKIKTIELTQSSSESEL